MLITIHNMSYRGRYLEQIRRCFDLEYIQITPEDFEDLDNAPEDCTVMVELEHALIDSIGDHLVVIMCSKHLDRAGLFLSVNDFSTIEIC